MPLFQFPVVITLATGALLSLVLFGWSTSKQGGIALPIVSDGPLESRHDPFDVTSPEDIIDGEPIDEAKFWVNVRSVIVVWIYIVPPFLFQTKLRGALLVITSSVIISLQTVSLGYAISSSSLTTTITHLLHVLFAVYFLVLAAQSVGRNTLYSHTRIITHLSVLTTLAFVLLGFTALFPRDRAFISSVADDSQPLFLQVVWYVVLGLYAFSTAIAITTPLGPPLHYPISRIYSEKTVASITHQAHDNVSRVTGIYSWNSKSTI
jgi:hypothetical protein